MRYQRQAHCADLSDSRLLINSANSNSAPHHLEQGTPRDQDTSLLPYLRISIEKGASMYPNSKLQTAP